MKNFVTAFDAKTHFSQILDRVGNGEEILITRRGKSAAKIVPIDSTNALEVAQTAALKLREIAKELDLSFEDQAQWESYRNAGKR